MIILKVAHCVGGVISPILSNIYLNRLDKFVETVLIPEYTRGAVRAKNPPYRKVESALRAARRRQDHTTARHLRKQLHSLPSGDPGDPGYRRLRYTRYADDTLFGFIGPKAEAEQIKARLAQFLREELKLELSPDKTLITHARTQAAHFLSYQITVLHNNRKVTRGLRKTNGTVSLRVPTTVVKTACAPYLRGGHPADRPELRNLDDHNIIATYGSRYRGIIQYYLLAGNVYTLDRLEWVMKTSMLKTLAAKHRSTVTKMARKHRTTIATPAGPRRCFEARIERAGRKPLVARFGGIPLRPHKKAILTDLQPPLATARRKQLLTRLTAGHCELCEQPAPVQIHQVRKLADLTKPGRPQPAWDQLMTRMRRKTLIVCQPCHDTIHAPPQPATTTTQ
ncbi:group II intron reverse transcriptase/maturase [Nonomuraea sp. NPDC050404]|uniref:group II intron reverse transcriptase/maturase n=1 Tax=Nonomuraea sp. NPDC050404 TaxID=3155783 RepID=UPI0033EBFC26